MNERIKELAEQAGLYDEQTPEEVPGFTACFEKFVELIVHECAAIALREDHEPSECILRHFGVER